MATLEVTRVTRPLVEPGQVDERAARRSLLDQIGRLESELAALFCSTYPRQGFSWGVPSRGGPRLLTLGELEELRDSLAKRLDHNRRVLSDRTYVEEQNRRLIEDMMLEPGKYKWMRIGAEDIGEQGCKYWEVRPRLGLVGIMMGWWRVKISSGCPLSRPPGCTVAAAEWESDPGRDRRPTAPAGRRRPRRARSATRSAAPRRHRGL